MITAETDYTQQPDCKNLDHIPGDYGLLPYLGNTLDVVKDLYGFIDNNYKKYGEISKIKIAGQPSLLVVGPENYKQIYLDREKTFSAEMGYDYSLGHFFKNALLLTDFDAHRIQRRMFQSAFKTNQMRGYVDIMNPLLKTNMDSWEHENNFLFFPAIKKTLLDVGATVFIGVQEHGEEMNQLNKAFLNVTEKGLMGLFKLDLPGLKFHKGKQGARFLEHYFKQIIPLRREGNGQDMLTFMTKEVMENGDFYPTDDIVPQASFLLFAAHDTTTSTLNHMILHLAEHPEWQQTLREESIALNKPTLDYDDLDNMTLMDLVFKETLRMHPSLSLMQRRTINETTLGGYTIPPNTVISIPPVYNHFMPDFWSNPQAFDPMRFNEERAEHKNHSFCYMPFGGGAHKCIGMHFANMMVKCFLHQFLLKYEWSVPKNYQPKFESFPLPKTADGLPLTLKAIS